MFKVKNTNTRTRYEIYSKLAIKALERRQKLLHLDFHGEVSEEKFDHNSELYFPSAIDHLFTAEQFILIISSDYEEDFHGEVSEEEFDHNSKLNFPSAIDHLFTAERFILIIFSDYEELL